MYLEIKNFKKMGALSGKTYGEYYEKKLQEGLMFQDYCAVEFSKIGLPVTSFSSKEYQYNKGENLQGYEFKNDQQFRQTDNLWIEVSERTNVGRPYVDSGIFRCDNTRFYVIGDYQGVFLIQKKVLQKMAEKKRYKLLENGKKTSKGFLLPVADAHEYFDYIEFNSVM